MRRKLAAGNWKMHGTGADLAEIDALAAAHRQSSVDIVICPPATLIHRMQARVGNGGPIALGGQTCHSRVAGAHTGDISAPMLADAGADYVIVGHSERRTDHGERNDDVHAQAQAALNAGLKTIICVGETESQRDAGHTLDVIADQLSGSVPNGVTGETLTIAYEPVWAIGTGRVPAADDIAAAHDVIRRTLTQHFGDTIGQTTRILYGGSVKPDNAAHIFAIAHVDGALVGGASLRASDFGRIIAALEAA